MDCFLYAVVSFIDCDSLKQDSMAPNKDITLRENTRTIQLWKCGGWGTQKAWGSANSHVRNDISRHQLHETYKRPGFSGCRESHGEVLPLNSTSHLSYHTHASDSGTSACASRQQGHIFSKCRWAGIWIQAGFAPEYKLSTNCISFLLLLYHVARNSVT